MSLRGLPPHTTRPVVTGNPAAGDDRDDLSSSRARRKRRASRGQVLVLFAMSIFVLTGMVALVIDVTWYWSNTLKVQRAADAAALAGVIYLPGNVSQGVTTARSEAAKNGYSNGSTPVDCRDASIETVVVTPTQDAANPRRMNVTVQAAVPTFFMRIFGIDCIKATRNAKAEFVLPVPMGSPENYYGIDQLMRANSLPTLPVPNASGAGTLTPKGFWGSIYAKGSNRKNGDAFGSYYNPSPTINTQYDPNGYQYTIEIPSDSGNGHVYVFDPTFCATAKMPTSGYYGTGDHWTGGSATQPEGVSTYFNLWDMDDTVYDWSDDTLLYSSGGLFENKRQVDRSGDYGTLTWGDQMSASQNPSVAWAPDCSTDPYHNAWWQIPTGALGPGLYRLQVTTTNASYPSVNLNTAAVNNWGIEVTASGGHPRVYGSGRMCAYNNLASGSANFYLAQIEGIHAGKTMEINLFDPGDVGQTASLQILSPYGGSYSPASFTYTADNGRSGSGTSVTVGPSLFDNSWLTIRIALPADYGTANITPPGEPGPGWWKIRYNVSSGNDVTTWMVNIRGNPVHLIVP